MPRGVPVATVAINGSTNAGLLAVRMLAITNEVLGEALASYRLELAQKAGEQDRTLPRN
jgi:5-(carboxyamino)imidazole ribonucleotide mutase